MKKNAVITILILALSELPSLAQQATVVSTGDGDTLRVSDGGKTLTIRLACIDAPETAQTPWGQQSATRLKQLLPAGQAVQLRVIERDRYGRTVAEIFKGSQSINLQMVQEGNAVVYRQYLSACAATKNQYLQAEQQARQKRLGFWNQSSPVMPWDFRRGKRSSNNQVTKPASSSSNCDSSYPDICIPINSPDLDCGDIPHRRFRVVGADPHRFDRDKDGVGCEK